MLPRIPKLLAAVSVALALVTMPVAAHAEQRAVTPPTPVQQPPSPVQQPRTPVQQIVSAMQPGWDLGNSLDAQCCGGAVTDETAWGNPRIEPGLFAAIKQQGFNSVRIPVSWGIHTGPAPSYTIDPAAMNRVQEVVDMALNAGLYVMIDVHHDSWIWVKDMPTKHDQVMSQYSATWTQIADRFKNYPKELLFEPINEQSFEGSAGADEDHRLMAELNKSFHDIVRASGGNNSGRVLVLPTLHTGADQNDMDALASQVTALNDPMLAVTTHNYGFWPFSTNIAGYTKYDQQVQGMLEKNFQSQVDTFVSKGIPVIIGEYGLLDGYDKKVERGEALKFFEDFGYLARTSGITTMRWDNGSLFDRVALKWRDQEEFDYTKTGWTTRSGTASTDLVFVDRSSTIKDQTVTLNLNGLKFKELRIGSQVLKPGLDYSINGATLTLKARLLIIQSLLGNDNSAPLMVGFSAGMPWKLHVISSAPPIVHNATGTNASLLIPTAFNGDRLETMEAVYADGTSAGPNAWTPYKGFWDTFKPDYSAGTIELTQTFLDAINENSPVTLRLHFWSGATLQYTVTRSGTSVTGTAP